MNVAANILVFSKESPRELINAGSSVPNSKILIGMIPEKIALGHNATTFKIETNNINRNFYFDNKIILYNIAVTFM